MLHTVYKPAPFTRYWFALRGGGEMKLLIAVALVFSVFSVSAQTKLRYAHVGVANAPQTLYADEVAKLVKERTNGRVEIQVFANSQLGGVNEMVDGVRSGAIQIAHHDF